MATLASAFARSVTPSTVIATLAATGITYGLLLWITRRAEVRANARWNQLQRQTTNLAGEVTALDKSDCRWMMEQAWPAHRAALSTLLMTAEDPDGR